MDLRLLVAKKNFPGTAIHLVIGHTPFAYSSTIVKYIFLLSWLFILFLLTTTFTDSEILGRVFGILGFALYLWFIIDFLNIYLDSIILTNNGMIVFKREGLLNYATHTLDWKHVQAVSDSQKGITDILFNKGSLLIDLEDGMKFHFHNIAQPKKQAKALMTFKEEIRKMIDQSSPTPSSSSDEKFSLLVETLGEVITEYMGKKSDSLER